MLDSYFIQYRESEENMGEVTEEIVEESVDDSTNEESVTEEIE